MISSPRTAPIRFGRFVLDPIARSLRTADHEIDLRPKCFDVLRCLAENAGRIVTKDDIFSAVWPGVFVSDDSLTRCVSDIRRALGDGEKKLIKTVPGRGYILTVQFAVDQSAPSGSETVFHEVPEKGRWPREASVAVLPFVNMSNDVDQDYLAYGISEDLITELSRFPDLAVIARNSTFQFKGQAIGVREIGRLLGADYVLEGSVRRDGKRIRITVQLTKADSGWHVWAERYDRDLLGTFGVQDEIARTIAGLIGAHMSRVELGRALRSVPASGQAYDCYLKAAALARTWYASFRSVEQLYEARQWFERAIALDPWDARSYAGLASTYFSTFLFRHDRDFQRPEILTRIRKLSLKAIELDPNLPDAYGHLGHVLNHLGESEQAIAAHERAFALNPSRVDYRYAVALVFAGRHEKAIEICRTSMNLDPFYTPVTAGWLGAALFMTKRYYEAIPPLIEATSRASGWRGGYLYLAATYARLGDIDKARAASAEVLRLEPDWTIDGTGRQVNRLQRLEDAEHFFGALRIAGLPA